MKLTFLGAAGTVTGSKTLLETGNRRILVDCGLYQGLKALRQRNWMPFPVDAGEIDAVLLTHAHIDHCGFLPSLVRQGFRGQVHCTGGTRDLCRIMLPDSARLQEEEADFANRHGFGRHQPTLPLYTVADAERALARMQVHGFDKPVDLGDGLRAVFMPSGHLLGASIIRIEGDHTPSVLFSGDLGRLHDPVMVPPRRVESADYVVVESTYGNRLHDTADPAEALSEILVRTFRRGGAVIVPAFAVGRAQLLMYYLYRMREDGRIPNVPIYLDSPMAVSATEVYHRHASEHRLSHEDCEQTCQVAKIVNSVEESKWLSGRSGPMVIIAGSGMITGGRVVHHIKTFGPDWRNTILLTGFQAAGTRGATLAAGGKELKIHGAYVPIKAEVAMINSLSAHADYGEILDWLGGFRHAPQRVFINHGEPAASDELRRRVTETYGWSCHIPEYGESIELAPQPVSKRRSNG